MSIAKPHEHACHVRGAPNAAWSFGWAGPRKERQDDAVLWSTSIIAMRSSASDGARVGRRASKGRARPGRTATFAGGSWATHHPQQIRGSEQRSRAEQTRQPNLGPQRKELRRPSPEADASRQPGGRRLVRPLVAHRAACPSRTVRGRGGHDGPRCPACVIGKAFVAATSVKLPPRALVVVDVPRAAPASPASRLCGSPRAPGPRPARPPRSLSRPPRAPGRSRPGPRLRVAALGRTRHP